MPIPSSRGDAKTNTIKEHLIADDLGDLQAVSDGSRGESDTVRCVEGSVSAHNTADRCNGLPVSLLRRSLVDPVSFKPIYEGRSYM